MTLRDQIAELRRRNVYWQSRAYRLERSRDMWRTRALNPVSRPGYTRRMRGAA